MPALAATPVVAPYVQAGLTNGMTVSWIGASPNKGYALLRDATGNVSAFVEATGTTQHVATFKGLTPGTAYKYEAYEALPGVAPVVKDAQGRYRVPVDPKKPTVSLVGSGSFRTNPGPETHRYRFAVVGDTGSGNANQAAVARQIAAWKPEFILHCGDVMYERGEYEGYPSRFAAPYRALITNTVFYPSPGNHDYGRGNLNGYTTFFETPRSPGADQERWYTFNYGDAQFFALDTNLPFAAGSPQTTWLTRELAASKAKWKFAFFHHPPYSSGDHGSSMYVRQAWSPLFEKHDVEVVFTGHDHHYERVIPREDYVKDGHPTTYFVSGGGGAWGRHAGHQAFTAESSVTYHFLGVTVDGDRVSVEAIDKDGRTFDRWQGKY
jgi:hypothetical protein